jgi:hypothetical protein
MTVTMDPPTDLDEPTAEIPVPPPTDLADPDAPYGRRADGTPKAKPGPKRTGSAASPAPRKVAAPGPRKPPRAALKKDEPDYRVGLMGLLQIPSFGLTMFGQRTQNAALQADGMAIAMHAPALAEALNETAKAQPAFGRALESLMKAGPYGAILTALVPLGMQLMANHKLMSAAPEMGIYPLEQLVAQSDAEVAAMAGGGPAAL